MARIEIPPGVTAIKVGVTWVERWPDQNRLLLLPNLDIEFEKENPGSPVPSPLPPPQKPDLKDIEIRFNNLNLLQYA